MSDLAYAVKITVLGMGVVFFALGLVALGISVFGRLEARLAARRPAPQQPEDEPAVPPEVVAAISAAITVALGRPARIHRVRYRKAGPEKSWTGQGRSGLMASHVLR